MFPSSAALSTTVSARERSVSVLHESGVTERYCLLRRPNGEVRWVLDSFEDGTWTAHGGVLSVGDVIARVPDAARDVVRWTEQELEAGIDVVEVDLFSRDRRKRSLERLANELAAL